MAAAFVPLHQQQQQYQLRRQQPSALHVGGSQGWEDDEPGDNSSGADDGIDGADITPDMIEKAKASHTPEEEASQGGSRFREMMKRAQSAPPPPVPQQQPPPQQYQQPAAAAAPPPVPPVDPSSLSVEEQAAMFRQMMMQQQPQTTPQQPYAQQQQQPQQQYNEPPPPPKNFLPGGVDEVGRKIGRNRDADAIQNSADLYFAQLKQDSRTRNYARYRGDYDEANKVFADPTINDITIPVNPYLREQQQKEQDMLETAADEMFTPEMFIDKPKKPASYSGISYRDKLQQRQGGGATAAAPAPVDNPPAPVSSTPPPATAAADPAPVAAAAPVAASASPAKPEVTTPPPPVEAATQPPTHPVEVVNEEQQTWADKLKTTVAAGEAEASPIPPPPASAEEEAKRSEIRTLMGLILKHRGGPGFGAGRLQGAEAERMESLAVGLTDFLKQEAQQFPQKMSQDLNVGTPPPPPPAQAPAPVEQVSAAPPASDSVERIQNLIACIEGAVQMYRNSPPELREGVLITLRAALLSAVNTCNHVLGDGEANSAATAAGGLQAQSLGGSYDPSKSQGERVDSLISCIEGAIQMYRNSPPELQSSVLVTLRAALMSGITTCNGIIAENEIKNLEAYEATTNAPPPQTQVVEIPPTPIGDDILEDIVLEAISEEEAAAMEPQAAAAPAHPGTDANSLFFNTILNKLQAAAGDGKMGLRSDLSAQEAQDLSESILDARSMLLDELDTGILPAPQSGAPVSSASTDPSSGTATTSKYQEMLAKAKAEKEANQ